MYPVLITSIYDNGLRISDHMSHISLQASLSCQVNELSKVA